MEAPGDEGAPEVDRLLRDRDSILGDQFQRKAAALGLAEIVTPKASPWCNGFCERVIDTLRRECTDHLTLLDEQHLTRVLREFVENYNSGKCQQGLDCDAPVLREQWSRDNGEVRAKPVLGGLHHVYSLAA